MNPLLTPWAFAAEGEARIVYQLSRLQSMDQWWHVLLLLLVVLLLIAYSVFWYRRDWVEIPKALGWSLLLLRIAALAGIFFYFLDLEKRSEQMVKRPSRVAVLIDTSLSMSLPAQANDGSSAATQESRMEAVIRSIDRQRWLQQLTEKHETLVYRFDQPVRPQLLATFPSKASLASTDTTAANPQSGFWLVRMVAWLGIILAGVAVLLVIVGIGSRSLGSKGEWTAYTALAGVVGILLAMVVLSTAVLRASEVSVSSLLTGVVRPTSEGNSPTDTSSPNKQPSDYAWSELLNATGSETRLGDGIKALLEQERGRSLAGIVVVTDGQSNAGIEPVTNISDAVLSRVPIFAVGVGSEKNPANVRMVDVEAPKRVFPGDSFRINALLQSTGMVGTKVTLQLRTSAAGSSDRFEIEEEKEIVLGNDDTLSSAQFDVMPKAVGEWTYEVKVIPPSNDTGTQDNALDTQVRVVLPNSKVLIIAGGPTREYQFVRNLLFRDATVQSHVFLQTAGPGMAQEAKKLLDQFPSNIAEMSEYDCVLAFDADWMKLELAQIEVLERWVSQQAGGLVMVVGPVATPRWTGSEGSGDRRAELLRGMAPVVINTRGMSLISLGRFESETMWPIKLSDDGMRNDFLRIGRTPDESQNAWNRFGGVYSYYATYDPKPGALPLAYFSDPSTANDGKLPIYLASHFYGAGRVVFQGSGEIWRIREVSEAYFDTYYTKLTRWASQGRLLRDSDRGLLLLDKEEALVGEQISVRAVLKDNQFQPLLVPQVECKLTDPQQRNQPVLLMPLQDPSQPGVYTGQFLARQVGNYVIQLPLGGLAEQEILQQQVSVRMPAREIQRPQRNDVVLQELATKTGGKYFTSLDSAMLAKASPAGDAAQDQTCELVASIVPVEQTNYLPGTPDRQFELRLMTLLMAWIAGCLSLEWFIRRMSKLA